MTENKQPPVIPGVVPPRKQYFEGPRKETTPEWKELVRLALTNNRKLRLHDPNLTKLTHPRSHAELAEAIKARTGQRPDPSAITLMLSRESNTSALVDATCDALGVPLPKNTPASTTTAPAEPEDYEQLVLQLSDEQRQVALRLLREMLPTEQRATALRILRALLDSGH